MNYTVTLNGNMINHDSDKPTACDSNYLEYLEWVMGGHKVWWNGTRWAAKTSTLQESIFPSNIEFVVADHAPWDWTRPTIGEEW